MTHEAMAADIERSIKTSIIIPAHGHDGMTRHCVERVLETAPDRFDIEVIVVDDASPQPMDIGMSDSRVSVVRSAENLRFSRACNLGVDLATGRYLLFLNNDTEPSAGWLEAMERILDANATVAVVGARLLYRDGTVQHAGVAFSQRDGVPRHIYRGFRGDHDVVVRDRALQAVTAACVLFRRETFLAAGGFDAGFNNGYEDIDLCMRIGSAGHGVWYCGSAVLNHFESVSRRDEVEGLRPEDDANLALFMSRWGNAERDEVSIYADDGLITVESGEIYPLRLCVDPELGVAAPRGGRDAIVELLNTRAQQVFDLRKEVGSMMIRLLDHGIDP